MHRGHHVVSDAILWQVVAISDSLMAHMFSSWPVAGWQDQPPLTAFPEVRDNRKPLPTAYAEIAVIGDVIPHVFHTLSNCDWTVVMF